MAVFLASDEASFCTGGQYAVEGHGRQHPKCVPDAINGRISAVLSPPLDIALWVSPLRKL